MYLPRWFVYLALAVTGLVLGWFAQGTALAMPKPTALIERLASTAPMPGAPAATSSASLSSPTTPASVSQATTAAQAIDGSVPDGSGLVDPTTADPTSDEQLPTDTQSSLTPRQLLATTTRATAAEDETAGTEEFELPWYHLLNPLILFGKDRTVDIAGFEDHSINVAGSGQFVVYDDSNLFVNRTGQLNANTGDTDSAGLNAIDTVDSDISSGPHCDDGCDDESIIGAENGHFDEDEDEDDEDDDEEDEESEEESDERVGAPRLAATARDESDERETRDDADTGEEPTEPIDPGGVEIGGDGWDDLAVRLAGQDNVIVYDDSNVVFGGVGDVNAQIGDSDTGGTVTMHTVRSTVRGGVSR
jgi:hypothetical protein